MILPCVSKLYAHPIAYAFSQWTGKLNHLEEVEISGWRGTEHEVAFVERLSDWGTKLKEMTVNFHRSISHVTLVWLTVYC